MAVPKRRKSQAKTRKGRAHKGVPAPHIAHCEKCGSTTRSHCVCPNCGNLNGKTYGAAEEDK